MQSEKYQAKFATRAANLQPSPLAEMLNLVNSRADITSFAAGTPDIELLPVEILEELTGRAVRKHGKSILQYGHTLGFMPLRETYAERLAAYKVQCTPDDIIIATGASGAINALCMTLLNEGDAVFVENPTYTLALDAFSLFKPDITPIETDDEGMVPAALEKQLEVKKPKFIYLLPNFQNPTGRTISQERRQAIAELAKKYDTLVLEDDIYVDLRYEGEHIPSIHSFAPQHTMYVTSASKLFAPAMRLGVMVLPPAVLEKVACLKPSLDFQTSTLTQALTNEFLQSEYLPVHLAKLKEIYSHKRQVMLDALEKYMPEGFEWTHPTGGMFVWVKGPDSFDSDEFLHRAIENGVAYMPGSAFAAGLQLGHNYFRLCFASSPLGVIESGIEILSKAIADGRHA